jgi:hypothetical protein
MARMDLPDLDPNERLALVALIKATALADNSVSEDESDVLADVIDTLGESNYHEAVEAVDRRFPDEGALRTFLQTIKREEARELIYGTVLDLAMADVVSGSESPLLEWLAATWNVEASIEELPDEG